MGFAPILLDTGAGQVYAKGSVISS